MDSIIRKHKKQKQKRVYFSKETEKAIVRYNHSTDAEERSVKTSTARIMFFIEYPLLLQACI